ncbi:MAG: CheR family methyltransferase [Myxococcota bacterium]
MEFDLVRAAQCLEATVGVRVPDHRFSELARELERLSPVACVYDGCRLLVTEPHVFAEHVAEELASPETYFFRNPPHYRTLQLIGERCANQERECRVLCAGVSTGEEAWSAAAVLEAVHERKPLRYSVVGYELSQARIRRAESAEYGRWSVRDGLNGYDRFFDRTETRCVPAPALRDRVRFERVNLVEPLPAAGLFDVIFFRNVSIYWQEETAITVLNALKHRLRRDGALCLGAADRFDQNLSGWNVEREGDTFFLSRACRAPLFHRRSDRSQTAAVRASTKGLRTLERRLAPRSVETYETTTLYDQARKLADRGECEAALELLSRGMRGSARELKLAGVLALDVGRVDDAIRFFRLALYWNSGEPTLERWLQLAIEAATPGTVHDQEH